MKIQTCVSLIRWAPLFLLLSILSACGGGGKKHTGQAIVPPVISVVSITGAAFEEGSSGGDTPLTFNLTLDQANPDDIQIDYAILDINTEPTDLDHSSGTLVIPAGVTSSTLTINVVADTGIEYDEEFTVQLSNPSANAELDIDSANGRIINDDLLNMTMDIVGVEMVSTTVNTLTMSIDLTLLLDLNALLDGLDLDELILHLDLYIENSEQHIAVKVFSGDITVVGTVGGSSSMVINIEIPPLHSGLSLGNLIGKVELRNLLGEPIPGLNIINMTTQLEDQDVGTSAPRIRVYDALLADDGAAGTDSLMVFNAEIDQVVETDVVIGYQTLDYSAIAPDDYLAASGTLTIPAGQTTGQFSITIKGDNVPESTEDFFVLLTHESGLGVLMDTRAIGTIQDDDIPANYGILTVFNAERVEGNTGSSAPMVFTAQLDRTVGNDVILRYATAPDSAASPEDYLAAAGTVTIPAGQTQGQFSITIQGDDEAEGPENFDLLLWIDAGDAVLSSRFAIGSILEDDLPPNTPFVAVNNRSLSPEGNSGESTDMVFSAYLDQALAEDIVISYTTQDDSAHAPDDYVSTSGTFTIAAGQTSGQFAVTINGDDEVEDTEVFKIALALESGSGVVVDRQATGYIYDNDLVVANYSLTITNAQVVEGDSGTQDLVFTATLDPPAATVVDVTFATQDTLSFGHPALAGEDYNAVNSSQSFQLGESQLTITIPINGDTTPEYDETFLVVISDVTTTVPATFASNSGTGTILTDDPLADISIADLALAEGADGTSTLFSFTVTLSSALDVDLTLDYQTEDVTTNAGIDYSAANASRVIPAGDTSATIEVTVSGDNDPEVDELFRLNLSSASSSINFADNSADGVILNDDSAGGWSGQELVFHSGAWNFNGMAVCPAVAFGPGGKRHILFNHHTSLYATESSAPGVWSTPVELGAKNDYYSPATLSIDSNGDGIAAWTDPNIVSSRYTDGSGWLTEALPQTVEASTSNGTVRMASNPASGEAIIVWTEPPGLYGSGIPANIWSARFVPGSGWQDMGVVETSDEYAYGAQVALPPNGEAITVFTQPTVASSFDDALAYRLVNNVWQGPAILDTVDIDYAGLPQIDINAAGDAAVVWYQKEPVSTGIARPSVYINRYLAASGQWTGAELVETITTHTAYKPDVAIDAAGNVFVIWLQESTDYSTENLMANRYDAASDTWSGPQLLEMDDTATHYPIYFQQVVADDLGNAIVVWTQDDGVQVNLRSARYVAADSQWQPPEFLETIDGGVANASYPNLIIDRATGNALVAWNQGDNYSMDIFVNRYSAP